MIVVIFLSLAVVIYSLKLRDQYVVPIVAYSDVRLGSPTSDPRNVALNHFESQMAFLRKYKYRVISLDELVSSITTKKTLPRHSVVLTFDDGKANHYQYVFPILKKYGFPATIFISPWLVGKKGYLTWEQIKDMEKAGIVFGSHTLNHVYLPGLSKNKQKHQISVSKKAIERHLGHAIHHFCYPLGGFTDAIKGFVKDAGYASACTANRGYNRFNRDVYALKRLHFANKNTIPFLLWLKLSGYYHFFEKPVSPN